MAISSHLFLGCLAVFLFLAFPADLVFADVENKLIAEVHFPYDGALLRGDVPVFGLACGDDFRGYRLEYGSGIEPVEWFLITESKNPCTENMPGLDFSPRIGPIEGNLGTWETGLDNYYYKDYKVDLHGVYTLRLIVYGVEANTLEKRVVVEVGNVITNVFGGIAKSADGRAVIEALEHSLYNTALVMSIDPVNRDEIKIIVDPPLVLVGDIYEIKPAGSEFAREISLKIKHEREKGHLAIYEYDVFKCEWVLLEAATDGDWLIAKIKKLGEGRSYYALLYSPHTNLVRPRQVDVGVSKRFDAKEYPIIEFDYKIQEGVMVNLLVKIRGRWYEVVFTDKPKTYLRINMKKIGEIPAVKNDNKWHKVKFNLYNMLIAQTDTFDVEEIIFANFDSNGYMDLTQGDNEKGIGYNIDNFSWRKREEGDEPQQNIPDMGNSWELGIDDGSSDEFSYEKYEGQFKDSDTPDDFYIGKPYGLLERAVAYDDPVVNIFFNLSPLDLDKDYMFYLDVCSCDMRDYGYTEFEILLNDKPLKRFRCIYDAGDVYTVQIKGKQLLHGRNKITIKWINGGNWVAFDYMRFSPLSEK